MVGLDAEFLALLGLLAYNAWQLGEIRKLHRACYVELTTARWEQGALARAQNNAERSAPLGWQSHNIPK